MWYLRLDFFSPRARGAARDARRASFARRLLSSHGREARELHSPILGIATKQWDGSWGKRKSGELFFTMLFPLRNVCTRFVRILSFISEKATSP